MYFDRSRSGRLNAPDGTYDVMYTTMTVRGAFADTFLRHPGVNLIDDDRLRNRACARLEARSELHLVKLCGEGLGRLGATAEVTHGGLPYDLPQEWSKALRAAFPRMDGILYTARHDDEPQCHALFDHCSRRIVLRERIENLDEDWFRNIAEVSSVGKAPPA